MGKAVREIGSEVISEVGSEVGSEIGSEIGSEVVSQVHSVVWLGDGWRCSMGNSVSLKKHEVTGRMAHNPTGAALGGLATAVVCGVLGFAHGEIAAAVMACLGAIVGAPMGAMLASSIHGQP
jgi:phage tail tape-measure protein